MITSTQVFAKRKEGAVDEAYRMALELMGAPDVGDWDRKAFCWCLIDIIKRDVGNGNNENLAHYRMQLEGVEAAPSDEVLAKGVRNALSLCIPGGREISEAKALGREGRYEEAAALYRKALALGNTNEDVHMGFGWELHKHSKALMAVKNVSFGTVKRNLNDYLKLDNVEKPSKLHSAILRLAAELAGQNKLSMLVFSRLWKLDYLRTEDFERYRAQDGKEHPSLAEKVVRQAGKEAAAINNVCEQQYILPHIDAAIERFPDNVWLKLGKAKLLLSMGMHDEALSFGLAVAKAKPNDFWAWSLLGDIVTRTDGEAALGCYCKALSCPGEDKFTAKIRLKVAMRLLESNNFSAAKFEVETVFRAKEREGQKIPEEAVKIASQPWFSKTEAASSNYDFYKSWLPAAEALLFGALPWVAACVGEKFTVLSEEGKPKQKRKIFLETASIPVEAIIPESKLGRGKWSAGDTIKVKGEFESGKGFKLYTLEIRNSNTQWDIFREQDALSETIGVVQHVNREKGILHFIVDRETTGVISLSELSERFSEGDSIALWLSRYTSKYGVRCLVRRAQASDSQPGSDIRKQFSEEVSVTTGMGFTVSGVFVASPLVSRYRLEEGQYISGTAVLSFNKKHGNWGWKAVSIENG